MVRYKRDECLAHPVVIKFLNQKLNSRNIRLWFVCNVWLYAIFLISLTIYTATQTKGVKIDLFLHKYLHMNLFKNSSTYNNQHAFIFRIWYLSLVYVYKYCNVHVSIGGKGLKHFGFSTFSILFDPRPTSDNYCGFHNKLITRDKVI